jgi:transcriptional regulator with XRE-family HTH domain
VSRLLEVDAASPRFGLVVRQLRQERGWSLRDLAEKIRFNRAYIGKVETGGKFPDRRFAELADDAFGTAGLVREAWKAEAQERQLAERTGRLLTASVKDSLRLIDSADERRGIEEIGDKVDHLAVDYLSTPPGPMLQCAVELRSQLLRRLRDRHYRPHELADLYLLLGRIQGVLAYAALDLGDPDAAMTHVDAAWKCAERANDNELRVWVRGTQSLIRRFTGQYDKALATVHNGLSYPTPGTGRIRLLCGVAQSRANLGDSAGTNAALNKAQRERDQLRTTDSAGGLFEFSPAKQHYYAGSSLIWLPGEDAAARAADEAATAIAMWEQEPPQTRSLDDEALAHVYQATAYLNLGDLDQAEAAVRPILSLPHNRQISWIHKRLGRFADLLRNDKYHGSKAAADLYEEIKAAI